MLRAAAWWQRPPASLVHCPGADVAGEGAGWKVLGPAAQCRHCKVLARYKDPLFKIFSHYAAADVSGRPQRP